MKLSRDEESEEKPPGMDEGQAPLLSSAEGYTNYGESQFSEEQMQSIKKQSGKYSQGVYAESKQIDNGSFVELPDDYLQVIQEKQQQPPPSRAGTRAVHKGKQLVIQKNENQNKVEQDSKQGRGWPHAAFYQNGKDARRGGTAPEGASRRNQNQVLNVNNPYNLLTTSGQPHSSNAGSNNSIKSTNQSQQNTSNGGNTSVNQQNQMIAKIYGKSNKFVHHGANLNDQYKKPKVHHMKEILRQKTNQQKQRSDGNSSMIQPTNVRKIKIDNSKLKSIQVMKAEREGEINMDKNIEAQSIRGLKGKAQNTSVIEPSSPISTTQNMRSTPGPQYNKQITQTHNFENKPKKFVKVSNSIEPSLQKKAPQGKTGVKITLTKPNSHKTSVADNITRGQFNQSIKNKAPVPQGEEPHGSVGEPQSAQDLSVVENELDNSLQQQFQGGAQTQGQGFQKGDQSDKKQQFNQVKAFNYPSYKGNQPVRAIHDHLNQQRNNQSSLSYRMNSTTNYNNIVDPNCSFEAVLQVASQDSNNGGTDGDKGAPDTEETPTNTKNIEQFQVLSTDNHANRTYDDIPRQGPEFQSNQDPNITQFEDGRHVNYCANNNVQFGDAYQNLNNGQRPHRRGQKLSGGDDQQTDLETLGKLFNENQDESNVENENDIEAYNAAQQKYCDMKRLQTSKGPRVTKYKAQMNQIDNKDKQDNVLNANSTQENTDILYANAQSLVNEKSNTQTPSRSGLLTNQNQSGRQQQQKQRSGTSHENNQQSTISIQNLKFISTINQQNPLENSITIFNSVVAGNSSQVALVQNLASNQNQSKEAPEPKERPPNTAPSSEMQRIQRGQKLENIQQNSKVQTNQQKYQIKGKLISNDENNILLNQTSKDMLFEDPNVIGQNQVQFSRTIDNINSSDLNMQGNNSQLQIMGYQGGGLPQPMPLQKANQSVHQPGHYTVDQMAATHGAPTMNNNFTQGAEVPMHLRNDQLQRPPSRQKEPNQALGLDDAPANNRPKTRGGNKSMNHVQFYGGAHVSGRDRKRNIQQFIPQQPGILSMQNMGQFIPDQEVSNGQNQGGRSGGYNGQRPKMIDFFHQRNNNINGFNSTGDQAQQYFQMQYLQQQQSQHQQLSFDDKPEYQLIQSSNRAITQPSITTHSNILSQATSTANQSIHITNPRRGPDQGSPMHGTSHQGKQQLQRPPSRHKDPPQNLGLEIYPQHIAGPAGSRMGGGGLTPHQPLFGNSVGGGMVGLDVESDFDGDSEGQDFDIDVTDNTGYFFGHQNRNGGPVGVPQKHFKEDDDDFFDNQYREQRNDSDEKQKKNYHQRGSNSNYQYQATGPQLVPGTAPSPNQSQFHGNFQYHPALQQTQNFYIGMNQIIPQPGETTQILQTTDFFNMDTKQLKRMNQPSGGFNSTGFNNTQHIGSSDSATGMQVQGLNHTQTDFIQRCFNQQRSPKNDRSEAIQQLVMQNPHLKHMNKPKSANGNRITNNKNRFKSLNNSGRFVGQNSTIIHHSRHSGYNNQNIQHLKMYSNNPKAGGWIDPAPPGNTGGQNSINAAAVAHKMQKSQLNKTMIKPNTSNGSSTNQGARGQLFLGSNGESTDKQELIQEHPDKIKEMIKTGQEINHNRPKESKGHRSSEKRHINNQSLGVTSSGGGAGGGLHVIPMHSGHVKRIYHPKNGNFVSSPLSGKGMHSSNLLGGPGGQSMKNTKQNGMAEMFSQTSKFSRGARGTNPGLDGQQNSMGAADMLADLTDGGHNVSSAFPFAINNQNSFKSQTLQFPNKLNSELTDDFINLFAN